MRIGEEIIGHHRSKNTDYNNIFNIIFCILQWRGWGSTGRRPTPRWPCARTSWMICYWNADSSRNHKPSSTDGDKVLKMNSRQRVLLVKQSRSLRNKYKSTRFVQYVFLLIEVTYHKNNIDYWTVMLKIVKQAALLKPITSPKQYGKAAFYLIAHGIKVEPTYRTAKEMKTKTFFKGELALIVLGVCFGIKFYYRICNFCNPVSLYC